MTPTLHQPGLHGTRMLPRHVCDLLYRHKWLEPLNLVRMVATVQAESQFWTEAVGTVNRNGTQDFGLFQLNSGHATEYAGSFDGFVELAFDPERAAVVARDLFDKNKQAGGDGFSPWAAYASGAYTPNLATACRALCNFAAERFGLDPLM